MTRTKNNTLKCVDCFAPVARKVLRCKGCNQKNLKKRKTYERTKEHNIAMSQRTTGLKRPGWKSASCRPDIADKIRKTWTKERREAARIRGLQYALNPEWRLKCGRDRKIVV